MKVLQKNKKRAVVTGGCGFIGGYVVRELLKNGYHVIVIDILIQGEQSTLPDEVDFVHADICDYDTVKDIIQEGDIIFHLAALTSVPGSIDRPFTYYTTNVTGTQTVLEAARVQKAGGVVFSSSAAVYGSQEGILDEAKIPKPESPYALHKYFGEELCHSYTTLYGLSTICLRYFNVYGPGNHEAGSYAPVTAIFIKNKREGSPLHITGDGSQTRDFIHVKDVARANALAVSLLTNRKDYF